MEKQKITIYPDKGLCEIYSSGFQIAMVSEDNKQCHPWVLCKDFLNDIIWGTLHKKQVSIYGLDFNYNRDPNPSLDPVKLIVRNKKKTAAAFKKEIKQSIKFLNIVERQHGFKESTIEQVDYDGKDGVWMITCDKVWIHAPPMISLLGLYIRVGCHYPGGGSLNKAIKHYKTNVKHNDARYLKQSREIRLHILENGISIFKKNMKDNYPKNSDVHTIHNALGIVNCKNNSEAKTIWDISEIKIKSSKKKEEEQTEQTT